MATLLTMIIGYMLGSIPFGLIAGRLVRGVDVREYGSGRTGGTNVLRLLGRRWAVTIGLLDAGKAILAGLIGHRLGRDPALAAGLGAFMAAVGHIYPIFANFRGGRGVATMLGGLLVVSWPAMLTVSGIALAVIRVTHYVSLGSVLAAASAPVVTFVLVYTGHAHPTDFFYATAIAILVI